MSAEHKHDHAGHDHTGDDHQHKAAPMVEEITDYEVLEIAVRELAIEHGLFTAEEHRKFTEWAEFGRAGRGFAVGREGLDRPRFQGASPGGRHRSLQGDRHRLGGTHRRWHP